MTIEGEIARALAHAQFRNDPNQAKLVSELKEFYESLRNRGMRDELFAGVSGSEIKNASKVREVGGHLLKDDVNIRDMINWRNKRKIYTAGAIFTKSLEPSVRQSMLSILSPLTNMYHEFSADKSDIIYYPFTLGMLRNLSEEEILKMDRMSEDRVIFIKTAFGPPHEEETKTLT